MFECSVLVKYKMVVSGKTFDAHLQILDQISGHGLNLVDVEKNQTGEVCQVTFVFCPNVSRVGTDIESAMKEVTGEKKLSKSFMPKKKTTRLFPIKHVGFYTFTFCHVKVTVFILPATSIHGLTSAKH